MARISLLLYVRKRSLKCIFKSIFIGFTHNYSDCMLGSEYCQIAVVLHLNTVPEYILCSQTEAEAAAAHTTPPQCE